MQFDKKPSMTYIYVTDKASEGQMGKLKEISTIKKKAQTLLCWSGSFSSEREELLPERTRLLIGHSGLLTSE